MQHFYTIRKNLIPKEEIPLLATGHALFLRRKGHEVLMKIKANNNLKKIPVIMLTTSSNSKDVELAYENGCNSYVKKPLEMEDFLKAILQIEAFWFQLSTLPNNLPQ
jgi:CheY-like chemotaxis protein